jgi:hypothetical protein
VILPSAWNPNRRRSLVCRPTEQADTAHTIFDDKPRGQCPRGAVTGASIEEEFLLTNSLFIALYEQKTL